MRVVFDCSAKYKGTCLNDHLLPGPDITNSLIGVLLRFRRESFAIQGDIQSMFHQVQVPPEDRDLLRFLWWKNGSLENDLQSYRMCVYLFGTVCSPSCANFALKQTAIDHKAEFSAAAVDTVKNSFYVDDCLTSAPTENEAANLLHEVCQLLSKGGFKITKWASNSRKVIESVPQQDRSKDIKDLNLARDPLPRERSLGLWWDVEADSLCFKVKMSDKPMTRRGILSVVNSIYDPLGLGAPAIQPMKVLLQDLCRQNLNWDQEISQEHKGKWIEWLRQLPSLATFQIPRCIKPATFGKVKSACLHHFSDASEKSLGYASYLRLVDELDRTHCTLIMGKTRLSPLKTMTIPRLELCAATIASQIELDLRRELHLPYELEPSIFWTDSTTVLRYINNETKVFHTFVANRVQKIRNNSEPSQWRYVPSGDNPADLPSRGLKVEEFLKNNQWKNGPEFLWHSKQYWPPQHFMANEVISDPEVKKSAAIISCATTASQETNFLDSICSRFSSWHKLLRVSAMILRYKELFMSMLKPKLKPTKSISINSSKPKPFSVTDIRDAEYLILSHLQQKLFFDEVQALQTGKAIKASSKLIRLNPFIKNDLLHVGGRLKQAMLPHDHRHPIIFPSSTHVTNLLINAVHVSLGHAGRQHVLAHLREKYWILKANSSV